MNEQVRSNGIAYWISGTIRVALRNIWAPAYIFWLRTQIAIWGTNAFEHAVAHSAPWLSLEILKAFGAKIGPEFDYHGRLLLHGTYDMRDKLKIGKQCHIGPGVTLDLSRSIIIEDFSTIALNAQILTHQDAGYSPLGLRAYPTSWDGVVIEQGAFIGAGAIIFAGVRVGRCGVVAAGAVVRDDVPPYTVVAGAPARVVKHLDPDKLELR